MLKKCMLLGLFFLPILGLSIENNKIGVSQHQILYLTQVGQLKEAVDLYHTYCKQKEKQDFSLLEEMGLILLKQAAKSSDEKTQILSMYGASLSGITSSFDLYESGIKNPNPTIQIATVQLLGKLADDRAEEILFKGFQSRYLMVQMETAFRLASRKSADAVYPIEGLMRKVPPYFRAYFPEIFGMIGTNESIRLLHQLMKDPYLFVRVAAFGAISKYQRDDFLASVRAAATHLDVAEKEAAAAALGYLGDSHSIPLLKELAKSDHEEVKLSASHALLLLGDNSCKEQIIEMAIKKNPFAIQLLMSLSHIEDLLAPLLFHHNIHTKTNAAYVLLKKKDARCANVILNLLLKDEKDIGFLPQYSQGRTLMAWRAIPSASVFAKNRQINHTSLALALREELLEGCLHLDEDIFLHIANEIFKSKQNELIPLLIYLLESNSSKKAIALLESNAKTIGAPFIRAYCNLALYRMGQGDQYQDALFAWLKEQKETQLISFREVIPWATQENFSPYSLTPEETSRLLIESYETLASKHDEKGISLLLDALRDGNEMNRPILAGILIKAIQ